MSFRSVVLVLGRRLIAAALATIFLGSVVFAGAAWRYHVILVNDAFDRTARLSLLLSEQAARTFEAVDFTLRGFEPLLVVGEASKPHQAIDILLRRRVAELTFVQTIRVLDPEGRVIAASDSGAIGTADPGCLAALTSPENGALAIGCTAGDVGSKGWPAIAVARRIEDADGHLVGVIVADIDPGYFSRFFTDLHLGRDALVTLSESHGHVLLASTEPREESAAPSAPTLVPPTEQTRLAELARASQGLITAVHAADGYPLSVLVGIDRSDIDRRWWQVIGPGLALAVAASALLLALARMEERHRAERRRALQRAAVAQKLEAMGQMTASVAHDFRNILTALDGSLRVLRRRGPDPAVMTEVASTLARGNAMIDRLLACSRRQDLRLEHQDVNSLIDDLAPTLRHVGGLETVLTLDLAPSLPLCRLDRVQFEAALMNLVVNARQAMASGGTIAILTRTATADDAAMVTVGVADTGSGIEESVLKRVFEPFFTTKAQTGTGLGLAQVQAFVSEIGGRVTIDSTIGVGTTVTLWLPARSAAADNRSSDRALAAEAV